MKKFNIIFITLFLLIRFSYSQIDCYTIVAGRNTTQTGSVIVGHNEDDYGDLIVNLYKVKATETEDAFKVPYGKNSFIPYYETIPYIWIEVTQEKFGDFFVNNFGLTICSNACRSKEDTAKAAIDFELRRTVAKYATSAKQAVLIASLLIEKYGYNSSGRSYCFADAREAWIMDVVKGRHWVAQRVADDMVAIVPNYYTIGEINLADSLNFMASDDIVSYAQKRGWYHKEDGKTFNFRLAYSDTRNLYATWNIARHWAGINMLTNKNYGLNDNFPFAFKPSKTISMQDIMDILSNHYEDTDLETSHSFNKNPHKNAINRICNNGTKFSVVVELHNTYPENNKNVIWFAPFNPCINPYIPIACSIDSFPQVYHNCSLKDAVTRQFDKKSNTFEANPKHAYSIFYRRNEKINDDYWNKLDSVQDEKVKFEKYARDLFKSKPKGKTSYRLLMKYYESVDN